MYYFISLTFSAIKNKLKWSYFFFPSLPQLAEGFTINQGKEGVKKLLVSLRNVLF